MDRTGQRVGQYKLLERLGEGGTGSVYLARHADEDVARFAAKVFDPSDASRSIALQRFAREATVAIGVRHPNLVRVHEWMPEGSEGGVLIMDFVNGRTLKTLLAETGVLPLDQVAAVVAQVASGLDHLHAFDVVHRDIKPANVVLARRADGSWHVTVVDFGSAKRIGGMDETITGSGERAAPYTLLYASPEQCDEQEAGPASDVYSLGITAAEMLAGRPPFRPYQNGNQLLAQRLSGMPLLTLADVHPGADWPPGLQRVLDRALAESPAARYASAGEFAQALRGVAGTPSPLGTEVLP